MPIARSTCFIVCSIFAACADSALPSDGQAASSLAGAASPKPAPPSGVESAQDAAASPPTAAPAQPQAGSASPQPPAVDPDAASYEVPVPAALADFARYPIASVQWRVRGGERRLEYELPAELIGSARHVEFRGPDSVPWSLRSDQLGTAECAATDSQIVCQEKLPGVAVDVDAVAARVQAGELAPQRLDVTRVFSGDPIGILRFPAP